MVNKTRERIHLAMLDDNPWQPRQAMDEEAVGELADSIRQLGLLQAPLGRRTNNDRIQVAFGHRRVAACRRIAEEAGQNATADDWHIEMDVADLTDKEMAMMALAENVRRKDLSEIEVVRAHKRAIDETDLTITELAEKLDMSRGGLSNNLRVLELPDVVLEHVESGDLGISVAREFLVLQADDHAHVDEMQEVIRQITGTWGRSGAPDWSRRHVRQLIHNVVSFNEKDYRPLGPKLAQSTGGGNRDATFDVDEFAAEFPSALHTIPAEKNTSQFDDDTYQPIRHPFGQSRLWTCEVKEWSRRQTRATREANKAAETTGVSRETQSAKAPSPDQLFERLLAKDPVWQKIVASRATTKKKGPNRPVTEQEKQQLGTRAKLKDVAHGDKFWKLLEVATPERVHESELKDRGRVPPWFNLAGCRDCVAGAAYGKSRDGYPLHTPGLICTNQACYEKKLAGDEGVYREEVEAQLKDTDSQDSQAIQALMGRLALLSRRDLRTLSSSLIAAQPAFELHHALGVPHKKWSYKTTAVKFVTGMLTHKAAQFDRYDRGSGMVVVDPESLDAVPDNDLLELTASLMAHHLRQAGKLETTEVAHA